MNYRLVLFVVLFLKWINYRFSNFVCDIIFDMNYRLILCGLECDMVEMRNLKIMLSIMPHLVQKVKKFKIVLCSLLDGEVIETFEENRNIRRFRFHQILRKCTFRLHLRWCGRARRRRSSWYAVKTCTARCLTCNYMFDNLIATILVGLRGELLWRPHIDNETVTESTKTHKFLPLSQDDLNHFLKFRVNKNFETILEEILATKNISHLVGYPKLFFLICFFDLISYRAGNF